MKRALTTALVALALAGCSATSGPESQAPPRPSKPTVPWPNDAQKADLTARLSPVAPKFDQETLVANSRYVCAAILQGGSDKALVATVVKHFNHVDDPIVDAEAAGVVESIRAVGFCPQPGAA